MLAPILSTLLALQQGPCAPPAMDLIAEASARAAEFDLYSALDRLSAAAGCSVADVASVYVGGLIYARDAARQGGAVESLEPVRRAIVWLDTVASGRRGPAEIARLVLHAAAAAAQSERDEMRLYLESAVQMESVQRAAGQPVAPVVSAVEMAGTLWLQVHRYEEARRAYREAQQQVGSTPQVLLGLARTAARLGDTTSACAGYRTLVHTWNARGTEPAEVAEGRAYLAGPVCLAIPVP
jgi:hypothetical protein